MRSVRHVAVLVALVVVPACSSGDATEPAAEGEADSEEAEEMQRPEGPVATVTGPLTGGQGVRLITPAGPTLDPEAWVEREWVLSGSATSYRSAGELPADGTYDLAADQEADYRTRIVVRRPTSAAAFSGTVVVEWLNVTAGFEAAPDWVYLADEIVRRGHAWVGVSAQHVGVEGGHVAVSTPASEAAGAGQGLRVADPVRYGDLTHPGDAFSYDIFTQVARTLRSAESGGPLGELEADRLLAVGMSQSGFALTTYANGVQPLARQYDGFLIHSRGASAAPLGEPGRGIDIGSVIQLPPTRVRTDLAAPVLVFETETDVVGFLGYQAARQPDGDGFRLWEVAGTAHSDRYMVGEAEGVLGCPAPVNAGPQHLVAKAALRHLDTWVRGGTAPPEAPRLEVDAAPAIVRDDDGIAVGGIRTPQVDVPVDVLSGDPVAGAPVVCIFFGSTTPIPPERLVALHGSPDAYLDAYTAAADAAIEAGFVLEDDRDALLADADPARIPG